MDPLHCTAFAFAHMSLALVVVGLVIPRAFDVFVRPERRKDDKLVYEPMQLMPMFVARVEGLQGVEEAAVQDRDSEPEKN